MVVIRKASGLILIAVMISLFAGTAAADDQHYTNLLIGDRASGMGGAYTAVSDDATGLYYNPAGVAYTAGRSISASVNAYYDTEKKYKSVIGGNGWVRTSSSLLPNYFGVVQPMGKFKVGFSYAVPESIMEDQDQVFHNLPLSTTRVNGQPSVADLNPGVKISSYIINFNNESTTYNFGPSIATELTNNLAAGVTLYYYQRKTQWILNQIVRTDAGGSEWTNLYYQSQEWGFRPILGLMWTPVSNVSVGLSMSKILIQGSEISQQYAYRRQGLAVGYDMNGDGIQDTVLSDDAYVPYAIPSIDTKRKYPTQISLGVAWFPSQSLLLSADINHYSAIHGQNVEAVNNLALGAEYYVSKNWAVRGGFFTDYANTPTISANNASQPEHIDLYGETLSISHFTRNTSVTLGGGYTYGTGKAQILSGSSKIQDAESQGWMLFLSSSYSY
jgi:long-subunit fatty acid transport protein